MRIFDVQRHKCRSILSAGDGSSVKQVTFNPQNNGTTASSLSLLPALTYVDQILCALLPEVELSVYLISDALHQAH